MPKILLAVSALLIAASAFFGFSAKSKIAGLRGDLQARATELSRAKAELTKAETARKTAEEQMAVATTKAEAAEKEAADGKGELTKAQTAASEAQAQITAKNEEITKLNQQLAQAGTNPGAPAAGAEEMTQLQTQLKEAQTKLAESEEIIRTQKARADEAESRAKVLQDKENTRQGKMLAKGLEGQILAVNQSWSFVVLGIGDRQGVVPNAEMVIVRDGQAIGKVRVSSVEPSTAVADIIPGSLARGVRVQPGDRVIYPGGGA